jgi:hypothetical protein
MQLLDRGETESLATTKNPEALVPLLKGYNAALENIVAGVGAGTVVRTPLNKK